MPDRNPRSLLAFVTGITLLTLLVVPATNWLLRSQARSLALPSFLAGNREGREKQGAEGRPNDYQTQLAYALTAPIQQSNFSEMRIERLTALSRRFPNEPSVYAHLLRFYTQGKVLMHREEQNELSPDMPKPTRKPQHANPADLVAFDAAAAQGERLDPDNAYFPYIRATGLYEGGQDAEAIAAVHRAAQKTRYEDYCSEEFQVKDRFYREVHGREGSVARISQAAAILFPHFASMRATARMNLVCAMHAERDGNPESGVQIRHDTMRVGDLMRVQGRTLIANLVGIAISAIPQSHPGGEPVMKSIESVTLTQAQREAQWAAKREKYYAYLRSIGHEDEARYAKSVLNAGVQAKQVSAKITDTMLEHGPLSIRAMVKTGAWWLVDYLTLANALGLLALAGLAFLAAKVGPASNLALWRGALGGVAVVVFGLLANNVNNLAMDMYTGPITLMNLEGNSVQTAPEYMELLGRVLGIALALGFPILLLLTVGIVSLKSRTSFAANLGRWLRSLAIPVACGLLLIYGLLLVGTARQEAQVSAGLEQMTVHEAEYQASLVGLKWPGEVK